MLLDMIFPSWVMISTLFDLKSREIDIYHEAFAKFTSDCHFQKNVSMGANKTEISSGWTNSALSLASMGEKKLHREIFVRNA